MCKQLELGIVGCGIVGGSLADILEGLGYVIRRYDPAKNFYDDISACEIVFICVPTKEDMQFNELREALDYTARKNQKGIIVIRSTVIPGMTDNFSMEYDREIVFMPEFLRERTALKDAASPDKVIIGTEDRKTFKLLKNLFKQFAKKSRYFMMKPVEAELLKVALNTLYTVKVVFGNELYDICGKYNADYYKIYKAFQHDRYIKPMHLDPLFDGYRGAGGKCLRKDIGFLVHAATDKEVCPAVMMVADSENKNLLEKGTLGGD
jgi:UDPglucose 6-dehydrogenase